MKSPQRLLNRTRPKLQYHYLLFYRVAGTMQPLQSSSANESPFLRLPVELRRVIYACLLPYVTLVTTP